MDTESFLVQIGKLAAALGLAIWLIKEVGFFLLRKKKHS
ncbi:hypothetical protein JoomaDRAFT_3382 [Galbibacter orientalis DSM 19592]|uniref:Uncharacterized protein n=1 Tax=Galbibacter orientalis DSM 19592 TaxID=926559 RepID=I3C9N2_9FLAO|nr:hypothetical protein JoomaDRAFT_3382 [Galbibacter orientalis DSM 19592]